MLLWRAAAEGAGDRAALVEQGRTSPQAGVEAESAGTGLSWRRTWRRYELGVDGLFVVVLLKLNAISSDAGRSVNLFSLH